MFSARELGPEVPGARNRLCKLPVEGGTNFGFFQKFLILSQRTKWARRLEIEAKSED